MTYGLRITVFVLSLLLSVIYTLGQARNPTELPEVVVKSRHHKVAHLLAYVREYSTLTTYSDTVFLFREKMVDYMLTPDKMRFKGWSVPRIIKTKSYYRFTNSDGLDSVSDRCNHHFSWSDWMGLVPKSPLPSGLRNIKSGIDTIHGKYSPAEIWIKTNDKVTVDVNVLADTTRRKWIPNLSGFFRDGLDFENFKTQFHYENVVGEAVLPFDLTGYSFDIESRGRGHKMFRFNHKDEPFFVSTHAEVYILDKEYITVKEAKKWEKHDFSKDEFEIYGPSEIPALPQSVQALVDRVDSLDSGKVRLNIIPDSRLVGKNTDNHNFKIGNRLLFMLKQLTGISLIKSNRNFNHKWDDFRQGKKHRNKSQL